MALKRKKLKNEFKKKASGRGVFRDALEERFGNKDAGAVIRLLKSLQLPVPQDDGEFMAGTEGCLIFINRYGCVIRIEEKNPETDINNSQWVLQPLARFETGQATVEICPACAFESDRERYETLKEGLKKDGLKLWDSGLRQLGRVPLSTPEFPDGMPVVVDRQAVRRLSDDVQPVKNSLQDAFYRPLRKKIAAAHDGETFDAEKVAAFWRLCEEFVSEGKLVPGWNDYQPLYDNKWEGDNPKGLQAGKNATAYGKRLKP